VTVLLEQAFLVVGKHPRQEILESVAKALLNSGDQETLAVLDALALGEPSFDAFVELAEANDSNGMSALYLATEIGRAGRRHARRDRASYAEALA